MEHTQVIIRPVVSEKSYVLSAADRYTFRVHADAHKTEIRQAVEALFDVHVVEVRTITMKSKPKRRGNTKRPHAPLEEGDRAGARRRVDPRVPRPRGTGGLEDADPQAQAHEPRPALRLLRRFRGGRRSPSPRRRSSKA